MYSGSSTLNCSNIKIQNDYNKKVDCNIILYLVYII